MASTNTSKRVNFSSMQQQMPYPDFLEIQLKSFHDFVQMNSTPEQRRKEGLYRVFQETFPITDTRNNFTLEFLDYYVDPPRYTEQECIKRGLTYSVPLKAKLSLTCSDPDHEDFDAVVQDVYLGTIPYMTEHTKRKILNHAMGPNTNTYLVSVLVPLLMARSLNIMTRGNCYLKHHIVADKSMVWRANTMK